MSELRVLHLFANYKWTGPADPAMRCAAWQRRLGVDVRFAQAGWTLRGAEHRMAKELWKSRLPVIAGLELRKHFRVGATLRDAARLRARLQRDPVDVLHCHLLADHLTATLALRKMPRAARPILVRSLYDAEAPKRSWRTRLAFGATDAVVAPTSRVAARMRAEYRFAPDRVLWQDPPTESHRLAMQGDLRADWGFGPEQFAIGITARIQPHRRFELLWEVARAVVDQRPQARFVLLGRGNEQDTRELVQEPVRRLGLEREVLLPGYLYEPEYSLALRSLNGFLFLVPGSDGTCRAMREAMGLGLPIAATPRGMLPDLLSVDPACPELGPAGAVVDESEPAIAKELIRWIDEPEAARRLGAAALHRATTSMDPRLATERLLALYRRVIAERGA